MKNMTYAVAIENAINALSILDSTELDRDATIARLETLRETLAKRSGRSEDSKAKAAEKRKAANAKARAELVATVAPILRNVIDHDMTAKEIYEAAKDILPADFTVGKVQAMLLRDMKDELVKTENKNKPNTYRLAA